MRCETVSRSRLNQRRHPPVIAPTEDMKGNPARFYNVHMKDMDEGINGMQGLLDTRCK